MRALSPSSIRPPLANYSHGIAVPAGNRLVITAGQLGIAVDESIPEDSEAQADICFANIAAILAEDGMTMSDVVRLSVYVTGREHMQGYRRSRDRQFPGTPPTTTLIVVAGLVRPEFVIEIEAIAAAPERIDRNTVA
ncbi:MULTISPECIES: RidA family protein [unclassified Bradyrhizobium]|uniref:RidA family protein n=1 Tax=unclassified Bradyrhizobium TaxID=2631580 RepID=UPI0028E40109|nr:MULTISPECIES: Rid family hydrolase [unclassified Bradyrhizobium]